MLVGTMQSTGEQRIGQGVDCTSWRAKPELLEVKAGMVQKPRWAKVGQMEGRQQTAEQGVHSPGKEPLEGRRDRVIRTQPWKGHAMGLHLSQGEDLEPTVRR